MIDEVRTSAGGPLAGLAADLVPPGDERTTLLATLRELIEAGGAERFVRRPVVPDGAAFPEAWAPTPLGVATLLRRLLAHGSVALDPVVVDRRTVGATVAEVGTRRRAVTELELIDIRPGQAHFELYAIGDDQVPGTLAHEVGVAAARQLAATDSPYRPVPAGPPDQEMLRRGSVAAVYLGLGVLAVNAAFQEYAGGAYKANLGYAPIEHDIIKSGYLAMDSLAFLVAVQAVVRGSGMPEGLRGPQADAVRAWLGALAGRGAALCALLGLSEATTGTEPARADPSPLPDLPAEKLVVIDETEHEEARVFRVRYSRASTGLLAGTAIGATIALVAGSGALVALWAVVLCATIGVTAGKRKLVHRCSDCLTVIQRDDTNCPRCDGLLVGELAHRDDRLDHDGS
jgi:hypothetical protein